MGGGKHLTPVHIVTITALYKPCDCTDDISNNTGVPGRSVRQWVNIFKDSPRSDLQLLKKATGRPRKTTARTLTGVILLRVQPLPAF